GGGTATGLRQWYDIVSFRRKADAFHHGQAVLPAQMAIALHREGSPVAVTEPAGHGGNINSLFNAGCREVMPEIMMSVIGASQYATCPAKTSLCTFDSDDWIAGLRILFGFQRLQTRLQFTGHGN